MKPAKLVAVMSTLPMVVAVCSMEICNQASIIIRQSGYFTRNECVRKEKRKCLTSTTAVATQTTIAVTVPTNIAATVPTNNAATPTTIVEVVPTTNAAAAPTTNTAAAPTSNAAATPYTTVPTTVTNNTANCTTNSTENTLYTLQFDFFGLRCLLNGTGIATCGPVTDDQLEAIISSLFAFVSSAVVALAGIMANKHFLITHRIKTKFNRFKDLDETKTNIELGTIKGHSPIKKEKDETKATQHTILEDSTNDLDETIKPVNNQTTSTPSRPPVAFTKVMKLADEVKHLLPTTDKRTRTATKK